MKTSNALTLLTVAALLTACSGVPAALQPYQAATLEPGKGLGDLRLGQTTLSATLPRFPDARIAILASDYYGFELNLAGGDLSLLFLTGEDDPCRRAASQRSMPELARDLPGLLAAEPACGSLVLQSLAVAGDFHQGATPSGVRLGSGLVSASKGAFFDQGDMSGVATGGTSELRYGHVGPDGIAFYSSRAPGEDDAPIEKMVIFRTAD